MSGVEIYPREFQRVSALTDELMSDEQYKDLVRSNFNSEKARKNLDIFKSVDGVDGIVQGSNSFANHLRAGDSLASPYQVLRAAELDPEYFRGRYWDIGIILRTNGDSYGPPNNLLAKDLFKQLKKRGIIAKPENPVWIANKAAKPIESQESRYGLRYKLTEDNSAIIQTPELSYKNNRRKFKFVDERGVPIFLDDKDDQEGARTFYTDRQDGLDRLYFDWDLDLGSYLHWGWYLAGFNANGRVAVVENFSRGNE